MVSATSFCSRPVILPLPDPTTLILSKLPKITSANQSHCISGGEKWVLRLYLVIAVAIAILEVMDLFGVCPRALRKTGGDIGGIGPYRDSRDKDLLKMGIEASKRQLSEELFKERVRMEKEAERRFLEQLPRDPFPKGFYNIGRVRLISAEDIIDNSARSKIFLTDLAKPKSN